MLSFLPSFNDEERLTNIISVNFFSYRMWEFDGMFIRWKEWDKKIKRNPGFMSTRSSKKRWGRFFVWASEFVPLFITQTCSDVSSTSDWSRAYVIESVDMVYTFWMCVMGLFWITRRTLVSHSRDAVGGSGHCLYVSAERTCGGLLTMTIVYPNCFRLLYQTGQVGLPVWSTSSHSPATPLRRLHFFLR